LVQLTGQRYYQHNEEIPYAESHIVRVFDENNLLMGDMKFGDAFSAAKKLDRDLVLRNDKVIPPIVKIMRYRNEILKKLFEKLGKDFEANQAASKKIKKPTAA
jgi:translation initiation factor IF-3